jgi:ribonuclease HII
MLIAGIDEAGRGSLLGPLVIGCVIIRDDDINKIRDLGVKDSKLLTRTKRSMLYKEIRKIAHKVMKRNITPKLIDTTNLNRLELDAIAYLLKRVKVDEIYIDSFDRKPRRLEDRLKDRLDYDTKIKAEHKADRNNMIVGAASIIAKVNRDKAIDRLRDHGDIGSGYPSDKYTIKFVKDWINKYKTYPTFARRRWKTMQRIYIEQLQLHDPYQTVLD